MSRSSPPTNRPIRLALQLVLGGLVWLAGCTGQTTQVGGPELVIALSGGESADLNPFTIGFTQVGPFLSGSLLRPDSRGNWHPQVAEGVAVVDDGRTLVVTLRPGARFHDGTAVTTADIAASINAHADPKFGGGASRLLQANGYRLAEAVDRRTVRVTFGGPWEPARTSVAQMTIWPEALVRRIAADPKGIKLSATATPGAIPLIGAGPYRLSAFEPKVSAVLAPVGPGESIRVRFLGPDATLAAFREGSVDIAFAEPRRRASFEAIGGVRVITFPFLSSTSLAANARKGTPTGDSAVLRHALSLAVDPEGLRRLVKGSRPAQGKLFGQLVQYNAPDAAACVTGHDPALANRLLDEAGYVVRGGYRVRPDGRPLALTIITFTDITEYSMIAGAITRDLRAQLQIDARFLELAPERFLDVTVAGDPSIPWDLLVAEWPYPLGPLMPSLGMSVRSECIPTPGGATGLNWVGLDDPEVDRLCREVDTTFDPEARKDALFRLHRRLLREDRVKPLYLPDHVCVIARRVGGYDADDPYPRLTVSSWPERFRLTPGRPGRP
jgi:ABC-type transport system substrate-binding protein